MWHTERAGAQADLNVTNSYYLDIDGNKIYDRFRKL